MSLEFHLTRHNGRDGVNLSLAGQFGNLPHPDEDAAVAEARRIAAGRPFTIERAAFRARAAYQGCNHD